MNIQREQLFRQEPFTLWLTGLSASGKSTIACSLEQKLIKSGHLCYILDGDKLRNGLNSDLGFSPEDRSENIRRVAEVSRVLNEAGLIVIVALISPYKVDRQRAKEIIGENHFFEIYMSTSLEICEQRDPKGLYKKARAGLIQEFTGLTAPYEVPDNPALILDTKNNDVEYLSNKVLDRVRSFLKTLNKELDTNISR